MMWITREKAYARAGLMGNPSDGFHGKTISVIVRNFWAETTLYEWEDVEVVPSQEDQSRFRSVYELVEDVNRHGYYGGIRLVKATIKRFVEFCIDQGIALHDRNFSIRYWSNIPRQVGLAGSSAIIVATLRCLMKFYSVAIAKEVLPSLTLSVETKELGIPAGLQDRVVQVYEGVVYMDFAREKMRKLCGLDYGEYEPLDPALLPPLYVAYSTQRAEPGEVRHGRLRDRYERGDPEVLEAMERFAQLTVEARQALLERDAVRLGQLINANYDLRESICDIAPEHKEMIQRARAAGATAKFAGSGGAIIGTLPDEETFQRLKAQLKPLGCEVFRPRVIP